MKTKKAKTIKLSITKDHIERGEADSGFSCPIGLALEERFEKLGYSIEDIDVTSDDVTVLLKKESPGYELEVRQSIKAPAAVAQFVKKFDELSRKFEDEYGDVDKKKLLKAIKPLVLELPLQIPE